MPNRLRCRLGCGLGCAQGTMDRPCEGTVLRGKIGGPLQSIGSFCRELCIMAEPIEMPFGMWTQVGHTKEACVRRGAHWRNLANITEPSMCGGDAAFCQNTLTTCFICSRKHSYIIMTFIASVSRVRISLLSTKSQIPLRYPGRRQVRSRPAAIWNLAYHLAG